jgi:hypothetical protein
MRLKFAEDGEIGSELSKINGSIFISISILKYVLIDC